MAAPYDRPGEDFQQSDIHGRNRKPCRACTDVNTWMKMYGKAKAKEDRKESQGQSTSTDTSDKHRKECPIDKDELGRNTWSFLHTTAAYYPESPSQQQQDDMKQMIKLFGKFYPCDFCAKDFRKSMKQSEPDTRSQHSLSQWMCQQHNIVNRKLGKTEFDCRLVTERWRDGWKDGSCD